jgi:hypothetical protein
VSIKIKIAAAENQVIIFAMSNWPFEKSSIPNWIILGISKLSPLLKKASTSNNVIIPEYGFRILNMPGFFSFDFFPLTFIWL